MAGRQSVFNQQNRSAPSPGLSAHSSYHPHGYGVSEGLKRARRPFAVRNLIMGSILAGTATGLYFYSIYKVSDRVRRHFSPVCSVNPKYRSSKTTLAISEYPLNTYRLLSAPRAALRAPPPPVSMPRLRHRRPASELYDAAIGSALSRTVHQIQPTKPLLLTAWIGLSAG